MTIKINNLNTETLLQQLQPLAKSLNMESTLLNIQHWNDNQPRLK